uniref:Haloacid dehalogenase-like hydrolase domain-containing protein 3 n=1 Tax=Cyprinus carpio TaxID=7962 RepID=A0A8C2BGF2_CYPCA
MRGPVRWVLWDVKDTLLKVRRSVGEQYCSEAERAGLKLPAAASQVWWTGLVRDTFAQCAVDDTALLDRLVNNLYHNFCGPENWEVFPDSYSTLEFCTALGLKQGVVSNFDKRLEGILRGCGLLTLFSFLLTSEEAGAAKPDPAIFTQALVRCGVPASSVVHVGDHYVKDYLTSRSLGIQGYLLDRQDCHEHLDVPPQRRLHSLDELPARLKQNAD